MSARTNLPNEPGSWSEDFSYAYLARLYTRLAKELVPTRLGDAATVLLPIDEPPSSSRKTLEPGAEVEAPRVFVRHDLDVSLARALPLARLEKAWGVVATYHVMLSSPFYDPRSPAGRDALLELASLGHEVGLHYDVSARGTREATAADRERDIGAAAEELEAILDAPVRSLSFHLPVPELINGPLLVAGRVSGYGKPLFQWYISDSRARFREGDPLRSLDAPRGQNLQLLLHPIWWGETHLAPSERLAGFLDEVGPSLGKTYGELDAILWDHIIHRATERADATR